jgi:alpha-beta hydrolase superfamily lysophospholipase
MVTDADAQAMTDRGRHVKLVELAGAKHDLHLDRPAGWREASGAFLDSLDADAGSGDAPGRI